MPIIAFCDWFVYTSATDCLQNLFRNKLLRAEWDLKLRTRTLLMSATQYGALVPGVVRLACKAATDIEADTRIHCLTMTGVSHTFWA